MSSTIHQPAITIPEGFPEDRAVIALVTQWRNCHLRYRICRKRVNWKNLEARRIERKRRKEQWILVARILTIEHTLLRWLAKETHHPDLWTATQRHTESRLRALHRDYYQNRKIAHHLSGAKRAKSLAKRKAIVAEIRAIQRSWMLALFVRVFPTKHLPSPLALHPSELYPRKITLASTVIHREVV